MKEFKFRVYLFVLMAVLALSSHVKAQTLSGFQPVEDIIIRVDTNDFSLAKNLIMHKGQPHLYFEATNPSAFCELIFFIVESAKVKQIQLMGSDDFEMVDTLVRLETDYFRTKIKFKNLFDSPFPSLVIRLVLESGTEQLRFVRLLPGMRTVVQSRIQEEELFVGDERTFQLSGVHLRNVESQNAWEKVGGVNYQIVDDGPRKLLKLLPSDLGAVRLMLNLKTKLPCLDAGGKLTWTLPTIRYDFQIKTSRLSFLNPDKREVIMSDPGKQQIEIQLDKHKNLFLKTTYRVEAQEEAGGMLIGELFTRSYLANDKVLCWFRPYDLHKMSQGYLYIKEGDEAEFVTNFNILEKLQVNKVELQREGGDWSANLGVFPGEKLQVKLEGTGLTYHRFALEGIGEVQLDTVVSNENQAYFALAIPKDFSARRIGLFSNRKPTGWELQLREAQTARPLDFVNVGISEEVYPLTQFDKPFLYDKTIKDIVISFDPEKIDTKSKLYGKQYLSLEVNVYNNRRDLIEVKRIENIVVCPGESSIRFPFYDNKDCNRGNINLNNLLIHKTADLPDWSRIEIIVRHRSDKHGGQSFTQKADIILQKHYKFDIDISFPAGLLVKRVNEGRIGNLSGISLAIIAQFSFFKPDKIEKYRPFRFGAGFVAIDAFNFNNNNPNRDVGVVALASVFPTRQSARFSFPIYAGFGYFINNDTWFYLLGPGIQVRF